MSKSVAVKSEVSEAPELRDGHCAAVLLSSPHLDQGLRLRDFF